MLKVAWRPEYVLPLPEGHRFPMAKYDLIPDQLLYEGTLSPEQIFQPGPMSDEDLLLTHTLAYWQKLLSQTLSPQEIRKNGFPMSEALIFREICINQGTVDAVSYAQQYGIAMNIAGGTHHAYADRGEGFCIMNDFACAANLMLHAGKAHRILIVDLDVHQGNGTAAIFQNEPRVFTFSMHGASNYPMHKEKSDLDIPLPDGTEDGSFLRLLETHLPQLIDVHRPDLIFYLSGVDVLATDKLGRLSLSREGCKQRDAYVLDTCMRHGIPVVVAMGGGYSTDLRDIVEAHCNTFRIASGLVY
jgi:acetoin utilization deacetylase AcuC-like enzyme